MIFTVTIRAGSPGPSTPESKFDGPLRRSCQKMFQGTHPQIKYCNFWWNVLEPEVNFENPVHRKWQPDVVCICSLGFNNSRNNSSILDSPLYLPFPQ